MGRVRLEHTKEMVVIVPMTRMFDLLRDPCAWGVLQPYCQRVWRESPDIYGWEFGDMIVAGIRLRPTYRARMRTNGQDRIWWTSPGPAEFECEGSWEIHPVDAGRTILRLDVRFEATLHFPQGLIDLFTPIVRTEYAHQVDTLLENLAAELTSGVEGAPADGCQPTPQ